MYALNNPVVIVLVHQVRGGLEWWLSNTVELIQIVNLEKCFKRFSEQVVMMVKFSVYMTISVSKVGQKSLSIRTDGFTTSERKVTIREVIKKLMIILICDSSTILWYKSKYKKVGVLPIWIVKSKAGFPLGDFFRAKRHAIVKIE